MSGPSKDPSVSDEPHLRGRQLKLDPSEASAERALERSRRKSDPEEDKVEHGVWDEPALSAELAGAAPEGSLYADWLARRREATGPAKSWAVTAGLALLAGPWAILGAFYGSGETVLGVLTIVVFGPVAEETMKIAAATYVVEKRPFLFRSAVQILVAALAGGLVFATIENLLYLNLYIPDPTPGIARWRWSVCVAMHMGCSLVAALGLVRVWRDAWERRARPRLALGYPYLVTAIVIHGTYNALAVTLHAVHFRF